ncbi:MAG: phage tail protein [Candidatus Roizmanbacteria bacterium]|nr:phage tail protein [Candidatus Roizmanbacteria bacterium]
MSNIKRFTATNNPNKYFSENWDDTITVQELPEHIQGAGCFGKGTLVLTAHGYKAIDQLTLMDKILSYDRAGVIEFARIAQIHKHTKKEFSDDLYFISRNTGVIWPKGITGNHAVYDKVTNNHKPIRDFAVGDVLVDNFNNEIPITEITIVPYEELAEDFCVYNLTVGLAHTYICGNPKAWIRVHNGGPGKSGVVPQGVEAPNTLQSSSVAYVLDLISHGPIVGIAGGTDIQKGIYFNNTPLKSPQGQSNFTGYFLESGVYTPVTPHIAATTGTPDQPVLSGFSDVETTVYAENRVISYSSPVIVTIPDTGKQAVRITLNFANGLWSQDFKTGDINGASVNFTIYTKSATSSIWTPAATGPLKGKTTSAYMVDYLVSAPNECLAQPNLGWAIKIVRHDLDDEIGSHTRSTTAFYLFSVVEIAYLTETYPNMAVVGLQVPAIAVNNSIPTRGYLVTGLIVQVPSNYDTVQRLYNGSRSIASFGIDGSTHTYDGGINTGTTQGYWDKSFKWAWTDNPAWILYNLVTNNEYGLGDYLGVTVDVDVWSFYEASLFNDCTSWSPVTQQYSKKLIANGSSSSLAVTSIGVYGTSTAPVTTAYVVVPGHSINVGDNITTSGVTGTYASLLNGTFGVASVIDRNNITINIPSTTVTTTVTNSGITLIDNSTAGFEHRFIFNMPITAQQDAWQLLQAIAGSMWGILTTVNGKITLLQDRPKTVSRIFNTSNVINGLFTYSGTEITTRTTAINVTFNDKNNLYQPKTISEWDNTNVALYGYIPNDIVAVGCVDESQARRQAKFALNTALYQPEICVFGLGLNIIDLSIGDRIGTQDNFKVRPASQFISGRVVSASGIGTNTVTFSLDRTITLLKGTYAFGVAAPDGYGVLQPDGSTAIESYIFNGTITTPTSSTVSSDTSVVIVHFDSPLPTCSTNYVNIEFYSYCEASGDHIDWWTVQSISESAKGQYNLTCISYNPDKWGQIENDLHFTPILPPSGLLQNQLPKPGTISFLPVFSNNTTSVANSLYVSWEWDGTAIKDQVTFNLSWKVDYENWVTIKNIALPTYQIKNAIPGIYTVVVTAVNIAGINSPQAQNSYNYYTTSTNLNPITVDAGSLTATNANVNGTSITKPATIIGTAITVQSIVSGSLYVIDSIGSTGNTTDFTVLGASANTIGTQFTATSTYSGTTNGTIRPVTANTSTWGDSFCSGTVGYNSPIAVQFIPNAATGEFIVGFDTHTNARTKANFLLGLYCNAGVLYTIENGTVHPSSGNYGTYTTLDVLEVVYNGTSIDFRKNGVSFRNLSYTLTGVNVLYFKSIYLTPGIGLSNLILGTYVTSSESSILPPTNLRVTGTTGTTFAEKDLHISWTENPANSTATIKSFNTGAGLGLPNTNQLPLTSTTGLVSGETVQGNGVPLNTTILSIASGVVTLSNNLTVQASGDYSFSVPVSSLYAYVLRIMDSGNINILKEFVVFPDTTNVGGTFVYTYGQNTVDYTTPSRNVNVRVYAQDTLGNISSTYIYATFSNAQAGGVTSFEILTLLDGVSINITPNSTDNDVAGFKVYRNLTSSFTKDSSTEIYDGTSPNVTLTTPDNSNTYYYSVAEYDSFDKTGLAFASEQSAISIGTTAIQWGLKDIVFTQNTSTNVISWTSGTIYKNGDAYSISSGTATWTTGILYIYYTGSGSTLSTTTATATAVGIGNYPLATYDSTNHLRGGDGSAFISGSQILAATVGTSQLIAGAVTADKILAGEVTADKLYSDVLQSTSYNATAKTGWKADRSGNIISYGALTIASSGTGNARMENNGDSIKIYDSAGTIRIKIGNLA